MQGIPSVWGRTNVEEAILRPKYPSQRLHKSGLRCFASLFYAAAAYEIAQNLTLDTRCYCLELAGLTVYDSGRYSYVH
jgi:hypothetical protein